MLICVEGGAICPPFAYLDKMVETDLRYGARLVIAATFVSVALVFGGGGSPAPLAELVVQIAALLALLAWAAAASRNDSPGIFDAWLWAGVALLVAVPLIQLIPLPPVVWHALPGRSTEVAALRLIGADNEWYPLSLAPYRTLASLLSLIPPVTVMYFVSQLDVVDRTRLLVCVAVVVLASAVLGVLQVAGGESEAFRFYGGTNAFFETGFQANRNATADVLLIGIVVLCAIGVLKLQRFSLSVRLLLVAGGAAFLALSVILTGSRAGTALLPVCVVVALVLFRPRFRISRTVLASGAAVLLVAVGTTFALRHNVAIERTLQRFNVQADLRTDFWQDTRFAIRSYWPLGSGVGTFTTVFPAAERLEVIDTFVVNRAHNDYLEFALEAGVGGCLLVLAALVAIAVRMIVILRGGLRRTAAVQAIAGSGIVVILALHSLVDYPMRSMSLAVLGGFAVALLTKNIGHVSKTGGMRDASSAETVV